MERRRRCLLTVFSLLIAFTSANSQPFIGVNYGAVADNLPPPSSTAQLLSTTTISKVRLYNADPSILAALSTVPSLSLTISTSNADIPSLAASPSSASQWLSSNALPFPRISTISVGNEVLNSGDPSLSPVLLPALQSLHSALPSQSQIKISTVHSMAVLSKSDPPSAAAFHSDLLPTLTPILDFLKQTGSPFMINPYPYFAYRDDPRPETLAFCLFEPNLGRFDPGSGITYSNMFDAQVDAVRAALNGLGFGGVEIVVAETGWPYRGDEGEVGASVENAMRFNGGLVRHLRAMAGTPLMPGKSVDTYIFALYDEDLKPGPTSERSFGLFRTDLTMIYDAGLLKSSSNQVNPPPPPMATLSPPQTLCVPGTGSCQQLPPPSAAFTASSVGTHTARWAFGFSVTFLYYIVVPLLLLN